MTTFRTTESTPTDVVSVVRQAAAAAAKQPRRSPFAQVMSSPAQRMVAPILGLYLGYAVVRLPEVFPVLALPHLPMILMVLFIGVLAITVPSGGWSILWRGSRPLRIVIALLGLVVVTAPLGIWPSESVLFLGQHYITDTVIFVCCLVFLRDRRNFRVAIAIYVLATAAVSLHVVRTYDPNAIVYNEDGYEVDPHIVAENPELRRLKSVGESLDPNDFGAILSTSFPLALWLSVGSFRRRVFWTGIAGLMVLALVPTQSRGSELGLAAAAVVIIAVGARGWRRWFSGGLIVVSVAVFIVMATGIGASGRFASFGADDYNVAGNEGRLFFWKQGMVWMLKRPWGYGISNFPTYFGMLNRQERAAHSSWVQYGMELGVTGLYLFISLCTYLVKGLRTLRKKAAALRDQYAAARSEDTLIGHMLAMMAGVLVTGTFLSNAYYPLMYMALGLAAATLLGTPLPEEIDAAVVSPSVAPTGAAHRRVRRFPSQVPAA
jgi:hypothetical protein